MTTVTDDQGQAVGRLDVADLPARPSPADIRHKKRGGAPAALDLDQGQAADFSSSRPRGSTARPDTYCLHCGRRMGPGRHGRRRYCSNGCRQGAYKRRRRVDAVKDGHRH